MLARATGPLEPLGGAEEIRSLCEQLRRELGEEELVVELLGPGRAEAASALFGAALLAPAPAAGVTLWLRAAGEPDYEARFATGRLEKAPEEDRPPPAIELANIERTIVEEMGKARRLAEQLGDAARSAARARAHFAEVDHDLSAMRRAADERPPDADEPPPLPPPQAKQRRPGWLGRLLGRLGALWRRLLGRPGRPPSTLPAPEPPTREVAVEEEAFGSEETLEAGSPRGILALEQSVAREAARVGPTAEAVVELERELGELKQRLVDLSVTREALRRDVETRREARRRRLAGRIRALTTGAEGVPIEIEAAVASLPEGLAVVLAEPPRAASGQVVLRLDAACTRAELLGRLEGIRAERMADLARRVTAALCGCRNRILDLDHQTRYAHEERVKDLLARQVSAADAQRFNGDAQLPVARQVEQITQEAAAQLERLLREVEAAWDERIASCSGIEQLRAEVAAIESGASYRLSLVCDDLRERITLRAVRVVLEVSRPLRQELLRKRLEVARGHSTEVEETFENVRLELPASMEATFGALRAPEVGALMKGERGFFDPLFRTLAREKRRCTSRLSARLDDIGRNTVRELFAGGVYLSPLLLATFGRIVEELVAAHGRWIEARLEEERQAHEAERTRQGPALELVGALEEQERTIAQLLEARAALTRVGRG